MCSDIEGESMRAKVLQRAEEERIRRARRMIPLLVFVQCGVVMHRESATVRAMLSEKDDSCLVPFSVEYVVWSVEILMAILAVRPQLLTRHALWLLYLLTVLVGLVELGLVGEIETSGCTKLPLLEERTNRYHAARFLVAFILQDSPFVLFWQFIAIPPSVLLIELQSQHHHEQRTLVEVGLSAFLCVAVVSMERATNSSIYLGIQAESSRAFESAAHTLLSSMCDAVVRLSGDFEFTKDCPRLSALLLRDPGVALQANFCDLLMHKNDKEAFRNFMKVDCTTDSRLAGTIHVTLRDAYSVPVLVQLFHTMCKDTVTDDEVHIVGLRDVGEERHAPAPPDSSVSKLNSLSLQQENQRGLGPISESSIPSSSEGESSFRVDTSTTADGVKLWVDTFADGFPLLQWTLGFSNLVGLESLQRGAALMHFFPLAEERRRITARLQHMANIILHGSEDDEEEHDNMVLSLQTKHWGIVKVTSTVVLDLGLLIPGAMEEDDDTVAAVFEFTRLRKAKKRSKRGSIRDQIAAVMPATLRATQEVPEQVSAVLPTPPERKPTITL